nr:hypothetical protein [Tanacetum cinerariifolium]
MEVEILEETQLEDLGLNTCNHDIPLSSREVLIFDEPKPQPQPLPNCPSLDASIRNERGPKPPIKPPSPDSLRMNKVDHLTIHTPPSPHVSSFHLKDTYCYYHPCIDDPKKHYGFKPGSGVGRGVKEKGLNGSYLKVANDGVVPSVNVNYGLVWRCDRLVSRAKVIENQDMAALVISISSDLSVESVGSSFLRVILIGSISVEVSVAIEVGAAGVTLPAGVLELDTHSSSKADPSESLIPPVSVAPMVSPILCSDNSESNTDMPKRRMSPTPHDTILTRWRSKVTSQSSSSTTSTLEIPTTSIPPAPPVVVAPSTNVISPIDAPPEIPEDSSSDSSARPSCKRCRSFVATITSSIYASRALVPSRADLLPPHKRFMDFISPEDSVEEDIDTDVLVDTEADATAIKVDVRVDIEDEVESSDRGTMEVGVDVVAMINILNEIPLQRVDDIEMGRRELEARSLIAGGERASLLDQSQNGDDDDNGNIGRNGNKNGRGNGDENDGGNGNGKGGGNGNGNPNRNDRGAMHVACECTYHDFVKCQPLNFKGTEGVVGLIRSFEKMKIVFHISNCPERADAAFSMSWRELMKLMTERFQELTMMCTKMVPEEEDRVEKFIRGLPNNIQGNVISIEPTRLQDVVRIANNLMDQTLKGYDVKNAENKRRFDNHQKVNRVQQSRTRDRMLVAKVWPCTMKCENCNKVGHMTKHCMNDVATTATQRAPVVNQRVPTCFKHRRQGNYKNECADKSFVSYTFSALLNFTLSTLDVSYAVELADGRVAETNTVLRGCTHPFNIDLMPVELGSFDVIIGMDWLANHHAVIVCDEKIVWIPYGDEVLIVQVMKKETKDKSEGKRLKDMPIVWDFTEFFLEDLSGLPSTRQVEFQIDLVPSDAPVARASYISTVRTARVVYLAARTF